MQTTIERDALIHTLVMGVFTGSTCGDACWHAIEDVCRCSCGGKNHGILNVGGDQPTRTCRIDGELFELVAVIPGRGEGEAWIDAIRRTDAEVARVLAERFPGCDRYSYGEYLPGNVRPVLDRKVSPTQARWTEVAAVPNAYRLVWSRPAGSRYLVRGEHHKAIWTTVSEGN